MFVKFPLLVCDITYTLNNLGLYSNVSSGLRSIIIVTNEAVIVIDGYKSIIIIMVGVIEF